MLIDDTILQEAKAHADEVFAGCSDNDRWEVLRRLLEEEPERHRANAVRYLMLRELRGRLYLGISRAMWDKIGWQRTLEGKMSPARFIQEARIAQAAGAYHQFFTPRSEQNDAL